MDQSPPCRQDVRRVPGGRVFAATVKGGRVIRSAPRSVCRCLSRKRRAWIIHDTKQLSSLFRSFWSNDTTGCPMTLVPAGNGKVHTVIFPPKTIEEQRMDLPKRSAHESKRILVNYS